MSDSPEPARPDLLGLWLVGALCAGAGALAAWVGAAEAKDVPMVAGWAGVVVGGVLLQIAVMATAFNLAFQMHEFRVAVRSR